MQRKPYEPMTESAWVPLSKVASGRVVYGR
jgi:hypothetical protein